ncbi:MAG: Na+/H+ antiporter subunit E [Candidatus Acetothermia bacterium]|nr:Na+/H+ antiporter subunit E [Candidatus Acetothermia bacterium]
MARWIGGIVVGALLWGLWALLWRGAAWPVISLGAAFPACLLIALAVGRVRLPFPVSAWIRWDLWLAFAVVVAGRVAQAVASTGWAILAGTARPGIVAVPVRLRSELGQLLLLWAITVTPGTIALLIEGDLLYVHCLHRPPGPELPGLATVERILERLWG